MAGFFYADELVIDLAAVSCVGANYAIVGGVQIKLPASCAYDLRRQFRAYKETAERDDKGFKLAHLNRMTAIVSVMRSKEFAEAVWGDFIREKLNPTEVGVQ